MLEILSDLIESLDWLQVSHDFGHSTKHISQCQHFTAHRIDEGFNST